MIRARRPRAAVAVAVAAALVGGSAAAATHSSPKQSSSARPAYGAARTPGVPAGGPSALYAPPPKLAMTTNHDRRFRAPYNLASGTERYVGGEYSYTGYAYDDNESAYPDDWNRYADNAGTGAGPCTASPSTHWFGRTRRSPPSRSTATAERRPGPPLFRKTLDCPSPGPTRF